MSSIPGFNFTGSTTNVMNVLTQTALNNAAQMQSYRFQLIQNLLNAQFQKKIAAVKASTDTSAQDDFLQVQISQESRQKATFTTLQGQYGQNANILADVSAQIAAMQNAASAGDSNGFDTALANANADISYLTVVQSNPTFQDDGVEQLKINGLAVQPSSGYDLSTTDGQNAALADLNNASNLITQISSVTTSNQTIAGSAAAALQAQISTQDNTVQNDKFNQSATVATRTLQLKSQLNTQVHLIELSFANANAPATSLQQQQAAGQAALQPAAPGSILSIFG